MRLELSYTTQYVYDPLVSGALTALRMIPRERPGLTVQRALLRTDPGTRTLSYVDGWGTRVDVIESSRHSQAQFMIDAAVETGGEDIDIALSPAEETFYRADSARVRREAVLPLLQQLGL